jgi:hypothetical protein
MNSIATSTPHVLEKRFVSSVTLAMLCIIVAMLFMTAVMGSENATLNTSGLLVLSWPAFLFVLSLPSEKTKAKKVDASTSTTRPNELKDGEFFRPWLGSNAYNTACANTSH